MNDGTSILTAVSRDRGQSDALVFHRSARTLALPLPLRARSSSSLGPLGPVKQSQMVVGRKKRPSTYFGQSALSQPRPPIIMNDRLDSRSSSNRRPIIQCLPRSTLTNGRSPWSRHHDEAPVLRGGHQPAARGLRALCRFRDVPSGGRNACVRSTRRQDGTGLTGERP